MRIRITVGDVSVLAELNDSKTAKAVYEILPVTADYSVWGDEIYFEIALALELEDPKSVVEVGDLAYWPSGRCFCIFYGRTPSSTDDRPAPASAVNVFGKIVGDVTVFKKATAENIRVEKA